MTRIELVLYTLAAACLLLAFGTYIGREQQSAFDTCTRVASVSTCYVNLN